MTARARAGRVAGLGLVTVLPLAYWTPFHDCFPLAKTLALAALGAAAAWGAPAPPAWAWALGGWALLRAAAGGATWVRAAPDLVVLAVPGLAAGVFVPPGRLRRAALAFGATALVVAAWALAQRAGFEGGSWISPFQKGVAATIGNPDLLGGFLVLPFALAAAAWRERPRSAGRGAAVVVLAAALAATEARAAWIAAAAAALCLLPSRRARGAALALAAAGLLAARALAPAAAVARLASPAALGERAWTWELATRALRERPLAGTGPGSFRTAYLGAQAAARTRGASFYHYTEYAHLEPLHAWLELGAAGLGLWLWALAWAFARWRVSPLRASAPALWRGIGAGAAGVLADALLSFPFHVPPVAAPCWLLLWGSGAAPRPGSRPAGRAATALLLAAALTPLLGLAVADAALRDGQALALAGRLPEARARYASVARLGAGDVRLAWAAGTAARLAGDAAGAVRAADRALALEPDLPELHLERGLGLKAAGDPRGAEAAYRRAAFLNPGFADAWNNLGNVLGAEARLAEAEEVQRRALRLAPGSVATRQNLALTLVRLKRAAEARRILEGGAP